jgi:hypothetical protein
MRLRRDPDLDSLTTAGPFGRRASDSGPFVRPEPSRVSTRRPNPHIGRASQARGRLVLIEPDAAAASRANEALTHAGFFVIDCRLGMEGFDAACRGADLVVIARDPADVTVDDLCRMFRRRRISRNTPILILGGRPHDPADDIPYVSPRPDSTAGLVSLCRQAMRRSITIMS